MKTLLFVLLLTSCVSSQAFSAVTIKFATVAPEGSTWMEVLKEIGTDVANKTGNAVEFRYYPGGIAGDEPDVLRKMRAGQYHAAGFTGVGLGEIVPETRVVELPLFLDSIPELEYVKSKITSELEEKFKAKGFIFLGWAEPGLVYLFTQRPIRTPSDMSGVKLWAWEGDPLAAAMINAFRVAPVHIALPDVLMALQTGMINAVYGPPLAAMALQWHTKVKYMMEEAITNSTGGVLVARKTWDKLNAKQQDSIRAAFDVGLDKLMSVSRQQNDEAIIKFRQMGIKTEPLSTKGKQELIDAAARIRPELIGKLYSAEFLKKVEGYRNEFREQKPKKNTKK